MRKENEMDLPLCTVIRLPACLSLRLCCTLLPLRALLLHIIFPAFRRASGLGGLEGAAGQGRCWIRRSAPPEKLTLFLRRVPGIGRIAAGVAAHRESKHLSVSSVLAETGTRVRSTRQQDENPAPGS